MPKTILVVRATGNYAQPVVRQLSQDGFDVRVFTRRREKAIEKFGDRFPIFQGDVTDPRRRLDRVDDLRGRRRCGEQLVEAAERDAGLVPLIEHR